LEAPQAHHHAAGRYPAAWNQQWEEVRSSIGVARGEQRYYAMLDQPAMAA
jgi:hypothetical protein